jgi:hypothetical protein
MLKQEELAFMKAISTLELYPALLRELRKAMSMSKRKGLASGKAKNSSMAVVKAQTSHKSLQQPAGRRRKESLVFPLT